MRGVFPLNIWQAPLAPAAVAATAGVVADRLLDIPLSFSLAAVAAALAAWALTATGRQAGLALVYLLGSTAALGAAYHHGYRDVFAADDIGHFAAAEPRPAVLRGCLDEEPAASAALPHDPLRSIDPRISTRTVLRVSSIKQRDGWAPASGLARLTVVGAVKDLHVGDEVEVVGQLMAPQGPANPGESDYASRARDQRILAQVQVREAPDSVQRRAEHSPWTPAGWLASVRGAAHAALERLLPAERQGLAMALLLGEDRMLQQREWDKYQCSGIIHVLAISGQHLVILAAFLAICLRPTFLRRRSRAGFIACFLLAYALMVGGRPPIMRAAVMVCAYWGALLLRRPPSWANLFALAWLVVIFLNPTDMTTGGCQLSFLAVAVLVCGVHRTGPENVAPLQRLAEKFRPAWEKRLRGVGKHLLTVYAINAAMWVVLTPLVASRYHLISPIALLIGPPTVVLTSVALVAGFLALLLAPVLWPLAQAAGWALDWGLAGCDFLVQGTRGWPGAYWYVADIPAWWVWAFYLALLAGLTVPPLRSRWRQVGIALVAWLCTGLVIAAARPSADGELRCTFLAVGHGGCTVLETPDGRVLLYDAGTTGGPDVTRRFIAPYLWNRGVRRVDEVFLSHADLDHYNGLVDLLDRFAVGQVSLTPTFAERQTEGAQLTLAVLERRGVPTRILHAGDRLTAGGVLMDVLHPPPVGPDGNENARSLVLLLRHEGHSILLTGDLEGPGQERVLALPRLAVDVLQAPHHGSRLANTPALANWARPRVAISCQGPPRWPPRGPDPYQAIHARLLTTWEHGAVTVRSTAERLTVETFRTAERWTVAPAGP